MVLGITPNTKFVYSLRTAIIAVLFVILLMKEIIDNLPCICYSRCNLILRKLREGVICTKECVICQHTGI